MPDTELSVDVLDLSDFDDPDRRDAFVDAVGRSCAEVGFLVVRNHGVPQDLIDRMYGSTRQFFELPTEVKERHVAAEHPLGFRGIGTGAVADHDSPPDLMEVFRFNRAALESTDGDMAELMADVFPTGEMRDAWMEYYDILRSLADRLLTVFARALELPQDYFAQFYRSDSAGLIANHYPPQEEPPLPGQLRAGSHTDFGVLTILYQDDAPGGLQVIDRRTGDWIDVPHLEGSYVVNIGDLMARWTNDRWVSTRHRVVNPPRAQRNTRRISIPYFYNPDREARIQTIPSCLGPDGESRYEPIQAGAYFQYALDRMELDSDSGSGDCYGAD